MTPLKDLLVRHEGLRLKPYRDTVGKLTIGVGRNLDDVGISREEAMVLLDNDVARTIVQARQSLEWFDRLDAVRKVVVASMVFNLGIMGFLQFQRMIAAIEKNDWQMAAIEMLESKWSLQVGHRATELAYMMKTGEYLELHS